MIGVVRTPALFSLGCDALEPFTDQALDEVIASGASWVGQYLENLTRATRDRIFAKGLGLKLITEARLGPMSAEAGQAAGAGTVQRLLAIEAAEDQHVTIDLESAQGSVADVSADVDRFALVLDSAHFAAELYVGPGQPLDGPALYRCKPDRYWRSSAFVPELFCGYASIQLWPNNFALPSGFRVDFSVIQQDRRGRVPRLWWPS
jgi:hypothetical protein